MAIPRPVIIAVLGVALIASAFLVMRGSANTSTVAPAPTYHAPAPHKAPVRRAVTPTAPAKAHPAPAKPQAAAKPAPQTQPADPAIQPVVSALESGKTVVLFVSQSGSADDYATRGAVAGLAGMRGVSVFNAGIADLTAYRRLLTGVAISQVPAVVVMRSGVKAHLIEGFVDAGTLRQTVADEQG
jgi:hypothetical protein